ncbi:hypothetical protein PsYK624_075220 [Phanerochaete sordida]|uniref:Transmembrane protein n=1 Tax=Phanerochaete sordida TaxID=48140 RepID=A0A9P3G8T4_9APHY|nr:hypothetical protein PsYK624_075220 [Phanerochaete sordida]
MSRVRVIPGTKGRRRSSCATQGPLTPSPIQWTDFAQQGLLVDTPGVLSRKTSFGSAVPPNSASTVQSALPPTAAGSPRKWTQDDQNKQDEEARAKAMKELVMSWMERLQLISVITTFFAAIESQLLGIVTPTDPSSISSVGRASAATLSSSLVVHTFAAILSFVAAFFLVRFRVYEASRQESKAEQKLESGPGPEDHKLTEAQKIDAGALPPPDAPIWSARPTLQQVGPLRRGKPPTALLEACHSLCMVLAAAGFALAMVGIVCYAWAMLPRSSVVLSMLAIGLSLVASLGALVLPQDFTIFSPSHVVGS